MHKKNKKCFVSFIVICGHVNYWKLLLWTIARRMQILSLWDEFLTMFMAEIFFSMYTPR